MYEVDNLKSLGDSGRGAELLRSKWGWPTGLAYLEEGLTKRRAAHDVKPADMSVLASPLVQGSDNVERSCLRPIGHFGRLSARARPETDTGVLKLPHGTCHVEIGSSNDHADAMHQGLHRSGGALGVGPRQAERRDIDRFVLFAISRSRPLASPGVRISERRSPCIRTATTTRPASPIHYPERRHVPSVRWYSQPDAYDRIVAVVRGELTRRWTDQLTRAHAVAPVMLASGALRSPR
jgi:hypothetical protein